MPSSGRCGCNREADEDLCRANIARNKTIHEMADETSNERLVRVLDRYSMANELACAAFACDVERVRAIGKLLGLDKGGLLWLDKGGLLGSVKGELLGSQG